LPSVVFVCPHGALKSRLVAALFNAAAPHGWQATSAGLTPQAEVSVHAVALMATAAEKQWLNVDPPRGLPTAEPGMRVIAIDCAVGDAPSWHLTHGDPGAAMLGELRQRVEMLLTEVADDAG